MRPYLTTCACLVLLEVLWQRLRDSLARARTHFELSSVHADLVLVARDRRDWRCAPARCAVGFRSGDASSVLSFTLLRADTHLELRFQVWQVLKQIEQIDLHNGVRGDVGSLFLESAVHKDRRVDGPDCVAETLQTIELMPLARLRLVDFELNVLADGVCAAADHHHHGTDEDARVLVAGEWLLRAHLVGCLHPVPSTVAVAAKTPRVLECALIGSAPAECHHHSAGRASCAEGRSVVGAHAGLVLRDNSQILPRKWCLIHVEAPHVVNGLRAGVTAEHKQVGLAEDDGVAVAPTRRAAHNRHDHPLRGRVTIAQVEQVEVV